MYIFVRANKHQHKHSVCVCEGLLAMSLGYWRPECTFTYRVQYLVDSQACGADVAGLKGGRLVETYDIYNMSRHVLVEQRMRDGRVHVLCRLPLTGVYFFTLFAALLDTRQTPSARTMPQLKFRYSMLHHTRSVPPQINLAANSCFYSPSYTHFHSI